MEDEMAMGTSPSYFDPHNLSSRQQFRRYGYSILFHSFHSLQFQFFALIIQFLASIFLIYVSSITSCFTFASEARGFVQLGFMLEPINQGLSLSIWKKLGKKIFKSGACVNFCANLNAWNSFRFFCFCLWQSWKIKQWG